MAKFRIAKSAVGVACVFLVGNNFYLILHMIYVDLQPNTKISRFHMSSQINQNISTKYQFTGWPCELTASRLALPSNPSGLIDSVWNGDLFEMIWNPFSLLNGPHDKFVRCFDSLPYNNINEFFSHKSLIKSRNKFQRCHAAS